jgi:2-hydroxychromene-2-carboxylate isomerase
MGAVATRPVLWFDLGSPWAYLAVERAPRALGVEPEWRPVLLGGLFRRFDRDSWARTSARAEGMAEVERRAREYGLPPVRWPEPWPGNGLGAMRAATVAAAEGAVRPFALAAYRLAFVEGRDLSDLEAVLLAAARAGLDPERVRAGVADPEVKARLRAETDAAGDRGVFGVPTVAVGDALFWGDDRLEEAARALRHGG